jgi:hypothetical protein
MIVCACRKIKDTDFKTEVELNKRLMQSDINCGVCIEGLSDGDALDSIGLEDINRESSRKTQKST